MDMFTATAHICNVYFCVICISCALRVFVLHCPIRSSSTGHLLTKYYLRSTLKLQTTNSLVTETVGRGLPDRLLEAVGEENRSD